MQSSKAYTYHRYSQDLRDQKKREVHTTSTQRTACGLQLFECSLGSYTITIVWNSF